MTHNTVTQVGTSLSPVPHTEGLPDLLVLSRPQPFQAQELLYSCSSLSWGAVIHPLFYKWAWWYPHHLPSNFSPFEGLHGGTPSHGFL